MQVGGRRHEYQPSSGKSRVGAQFSMWYRVASDFCLYTSKFYWSSSLDVVLAGSSSKKVQGSIFVLSLVAPHIMFIWFTTNEQVRKTSQYCKQKKRNEIKEYTMKYLKWSTFFVSLTAYCTKIAWSFQRNKRQGWWRKPRRQVMAEAKNPWVDSDGDGDSLSLEEAAARDEKQG